MRMKIRFLFHASFFVVVGFFVCLMNNCSRGENTIVEDRLL